MVDFDFPQKDSLPEFGQESGLELGQESGQELGRETWLLGQLLGQDLAGPITPSLDIAPDIASMKECRLARSTGIHCDCNSIKPDINFS